MSLLAFAKILNIPVILIIDAKSMAGSAGAVVYGFENYNKDVRVAGVIFNNIGSENHYRMLKEAVEHMCKATVLGYLQKDSNIAIPSRHLGLVTAEDNLLSEKIIDKLSDIMETSINLDKILEVSSINSNLSIFNIYIKRKEEKRITLAVAYDKAFNFYYQDNLDILTEYGTELKLFSPLNDKNLPSDMTAFILAAAIQRYMQKSLRQICL